MKLRVSSSCFANATEREGTEDQIWNLIDFAMDVETIVWDDAREEIADAKKFAKRDLEADGFTEFGNVRFQIWKD